MQNLAQRAFITYLKSVCKEKDKEVFDVMKLGIDDFSASLGLPLTPKIRFLNQKNVGKTLSKPGSTVALDKSATENLLEPLDIRHSEADEEESDEDESDNDLLKEESLSKLKPAITEIESVVYVELSFCPFRSSSILRCTFIHGFLKSFFGYYQLAFLVLC